MLSETVGFIHYHSTLDSGIQSSRDVFKPSMIFLYSSLRITAFPSFVLILFTGTLITPYTYIIMYVLILEKNS